MTAENDSGGGRPLARSVRRALQKRSIILVGLFYGSMYVLANFFEPQPREMTKSIRDAKIR